MLMVTDRDQSTVIATTTIGGGSGVVVVVVVVEVDLVPMAASGSVLATVIRPRRSPHD